MNNWNEGIAESDEDDELLADMYNTRETTLFLIESTPSMLAPDLELDRATTNMGWKGGPARSKLELALRAAWAMMRRKVISAPKDHIGVIIFNTEESTRTVHGSTQHIQSAVDLDQIKAKTISSLQELLTEAERDPDSLGRLFGPQTASPQTNLTAAFNAASTAFRERAPQRSQKRIYLVTDNDDPVAGDPRQFEVAMNTRRNVVENGYELETFLIPKGPEEQFDLAKFYSEFAAMGAESADELEEGAHWAVVHGDLGATLHGMVHSMRSKEAQKRVSFKVNFTLADGLTIGVAGYNLIGEERKALPVEVDLGTADGVQVIKKTIYKDGNTGAEIDFKTQVKKYFGVGKAEHEFKVFFDEMQLRSLKRIGLDVGLTLIGFKPRKHFLRFHEQIKHANFIYPDEERFAGSTRTFAALLDSMVRKKRVAICRFIGSVIGRPEMVMLIPQAEKVDELSGVQLLPPGMHMCHLPFADDVRKHNLGETHSIIASLSDSQLADEDFVPSDPPALTAAMKVVKYMSRTYDPDAYPNPALNLHYETLAALSINEPMPEQVDKTVPAYALIDSRVGKYIEQLKNAAGEGQDGEGEVSDEEVQLRKKRARDAASSEDLAPVRDQLKQEGLSMSLAELKGAAKVADVKVSGTKQDLYDRLVKAFAGRGMWDDDGDGGARKKKAKKAKGAVEEVDEYDWE